MIALTVSLMSAYLLGSISPSYLLGKWLKGIDLRDHGSGNVGATNAFRVLGKAPGSLTLFLDVSKGFLSIYPLASFFESHFSIPIGPSVYRILMGLAVISGHNWTLFLKFRGGKGVATSLGVFLALAPDATGIVFGIWCLTALLFRRVSLGSLAAALCAPLVLFWLHKPRALILFGLLLAFVIFYTHRSNIRKIFFEKR